MRTIFSVNEITMVDVLWVGVLLPVLIFFVLGVVLLIKPDLKNKVPSFMLGSFKQSSSKVLALFLIALPTIIGGAHLVVTQVTLNTEKGYFENGDYATISARYSITDEFDGHTLRFGQKTYSVPGGLHGSLKLSNVIATRLEDGATYELRVKDDIILQIKAEN